MSSAALSSAVVGRSVPQILRVKACKWNLKERCDPEGGWLVMSVPLQVLGPFPSLLPGSHDTNSFFYLLLPMSCHNVLPCHRPQSIRVNQLWAETPQTRNQISLQSLRPHSYHLRRSSALMESYQLMCLATKKPMSV